MPDLQANYQTNPDRDSNGAYGSRILLLFILGVAFSSGGLTVPALVVQPRNRKRQMSMCAPLHLRHRATPNSRVSAKSKKSTQAGQTGFTSRPNSASHTRTYNRNTPLLPDHSTSRF